MAMTDTSKTPEPRRAEQAGASATAPAGKQATAGESTDPEVQRLLAVKQTHQMNRDLIDPPVVDENGLADIDDAIADVDDLLADLGYPQESQKDRKARLERDAKAAAEKVDALAKRRADRAEARAK